CAEPDMVFVLERHPQMDCGTFAVDGTSCTSAGAIVCAAIHSPGSGRLGHCENCHQPFQHDWACIPAECSGCRALVYRGTPAGWNLDAFAVDQRVLFGGISCSIQCRVLLKLELRAFRNRDDLRIPWSTRSQCYGS